MHKSCRAQRNIALIFLLISNDNYDKIESQFQNHRNISEDWLNIKRCIFKGMYKNPYLLSEIFKIYIETNAEKS